MAAFFVIAMDAAYQVAVQVDSHGRVCAHAPVVVSAVSSITAALTKFWEFRRFPINNVLISLIYM